MRMIPRLAVCLTALLAVHATVRPAAAQSQAQTGAFIIRLGTDTIGAERYTLSGNSYSIEQLLRSPRTSLRHTHLELTPDGDVATLHLKNHRIGAAPDAPLLGGTKMTTRGDSASVEITRNDSTINRTVAATRALGPSLQGSYTGYQIAALRLRAMARDSMSGSFVNPQGNAVPVTVTRRGADSMTFTMPAFQLRARVDAEGRILGMKQPGSVTVERVSSIDMDALAREWSVLDERGMAMGSLSPVDSASLDLAGVHIAVQYSRPKARGRVIFGDVVPWNKVWRTGAGAATRLTTDRDIYVGRFLLPAGSYSLFTIPTRRGTTLIINDEIERNGEPLSGGDYDVKRNIARVPMTTTRRVNGVEQFGISLTPRGTRRATLEMVWERRQMTVPIRIP